MNCALCGRACGVDRATGEIGFCAMGELPALARAALHHWEEPCISGTRGSGAVFFSGCSLRCGYCQNYEISHMRFGTEVDVARLREIFEELIDQGAHNINLINPTHFVPAILRALGRKLPVPVVYNSHGYDGLQALRALKGKIDIYLPDLKYFYKLPARRYSGVEDYFEIASRAIDEMVAQVGPPVMDGDGLMRSGVLIRHLLLPLQAEGAMRIIDHVKARYGERVLFSLMRQYTPNAISARYPEIDRRVTEEEYAQVERYLFDSGLEGFVQEDGSADAAYLPAFDLSGVLPKEEDPFGALGGEG
ncbi:MAG: 4Fe-4S cluster-binding domain-containing protein [Christensenellaceae bacterium]|jgi:putative pyruvate formate lyase activating enzyme|nr:4Fe-4S cluster-binding domain-containing protein [Christensenellaceae bacterium]